MTMTIRNSYLLINLDDRMSEEWRNGWKQAAMYVGNVEPVRDSHDESDSTLPDPNVLRCTKKQKRY